MKRARSDGKLRKHLLSSSITATMTPKATIAVPTPQPMATFCLVLSLAQHAHEQRLQQFIALLLHFRRQAVQQAAHLPGVALDALILAICADAMAAKNKNRTTVNVPKHRF